MLESILPPFYPINCMGLWFKDFCSTTQNPLYLFCIPDRLKSCSGHGNWRIQMRFVHQLMTFLYKLWCFCYDIIGNGILIEAVSELCTLWRGSFLHVCWGVSASLLCHSGHPLRHSTYVPVCCSTLLCLIPSHSNVISTSNSHQRL